MPGSTKTKRKRSMAENCDPHALYQESVQCVEAEIDFVDDTFKALRGRRAQFLREDFCGTANTSCEWVRRRPDNTAVAVDVDPDVLAWGRRHNVAGLEPPAAARLELICADVRGVVTRPVDIVLAMNFSYWYFKQRAELRNYFRRVRQHLGSDGILFLDAFGGYDAQRVIKERTDYEGFSYIWHQAYFNPINHDYLCHIDFRFPDGSKLKEAFSYDWRLWSLPELREVLDEAGYRRSSVYWQRDEEEDGEAEGEFYATEEGEADAGWVVYIVAEK